MKRNVSKQERENIVQGKSGKFYDNTLIFKNKK